MAKDLLTPNKLEKMDKTTAVGGGLYVIVRGKSKSYGFRGTLNGRQLPMMHAWLDEVCGDAGWTSAPAGFTGVVNDAVAFYFDDAALAQAFVNRFCCGYRPVEVDRSVEGAFSLRSEASSRRAHKIP